MMGCRLGSCFCNIDYYSLMFPHVPTVLLPVMFQSAACSFGVDQNCLPPASNWDQSGAAGGHVPSVTVI